MLSMTADQKIKMTPEWYSKYCQLAAANVLNRDRQLRFDYNRLRKARDASALHYDDCIPRDVLELFRNVYETTVKMAGSYEPSDEEQNILMQVLLNIHVGYQMITGDLLNTQFSEHYSEQFARRMI